MILHTKSQLSSLEKERLAQLIEFAGGAAHLGAMLDLSPQTVQGWTTRGRISMAAAKLVAVHPAFAEKFPLHYMRPELETLETK